jgi:molybdenum cofactor synthesis domain-containing protein
MSDGRVQAAVLLIGDELLSGRTQDTNLQTIARFLAPLGVQVAYAAIAPDEPDEIVATLNRLRARYAYVFTTGGIGPTHDDKTADAVAAAFGVPIDVRADARAILEAHYKTTDINEARLRMARIPDGASLIANPISKAPGFQIGNVFVLAGVPSVMRGMLEDIVHRLEGGAVVRSVTVRCPQMREGDIAKPLADLAADMAEVSFGSYPFYGPGDAFGVSLVARGVEEALLAVAEERLKGIATAFGMEANVERS